MIMVDTSVWIDYFAGRINPQTDTLDQLLGSTPIAMGDLILTEVLQGYRNDRDYRLARKLFAELITFELLGEDMAIRSAVNFRSLRKKGITIRKSADVIIASFCIEKKLPLLFSDRDFQPFVDYMGMRAA